MFRMPSPAINCIPLSIAKILKTSGSHIPSTSALPYDKALPTSSLNSQPKPTLLLEGSKAPSTLSFR